MEEPTPPGAPDPERPEPGGPEQDPDSDSTGSAPSPGSDVPAPGRATMSGRARVYDTSRSVDDDAHRTVELVGGDRSPRRFPLRWLATLAAAVTMGAVVLGVLWTWLAGRSGAGSSAADAPSAQPDVGGSPSTGATPSTPGPAGGSPPGPSGGSGPATAGDGGGPSATHQAAGGGSGCSIDPGCDSIDQSCNHAVDRTCNDTLNNACNSIVDDTCGSTMRSCTVGDPCGGTTCGDSGVAHLPARLVELGATLPPVHRIGGRPTLPARAAAAAIRGYQRRLSPGLPTLCRYTPSCSRYGLAAVRRYGLAAGLRLAAARIRRCTPDTAPGTDDPLPA